MPDSFCEHDSTSPHKQAAVNANANGSKACAHHARCLAAWRLEQLAAKVHESHAGP
jgi:hypothetical protein